MQYWIWIGLVLAGVQFSAECGGDDVRAGSEAAAEKSPRWSSNVNPFHEMLRNVRNKKSDDFEDCYSCDCKCHDNGCRDKGGKCRGKTETIMWNRKPLDRVKCFCVRANDQANEEYWNGRVNYTHHVVEKHDGVVHHGNFQKVDWKGKN